MEEGEGVEGVRPHHLALPTLLRDKQRLNGGLVRSAGPVLVLLIRVGAVHWAVADQDNPRCGGSGRRA